MQDYSQENDDGEQPEYEGFDLERYKAFWRQWVDSYGEARRQSFRDQEYYDGDVKGTGEGHWTSTELLELSNRNQPPSVFNLIKRKINAIAGVEQRTRTEPRALPRTPKDQQAAEVATDALRFVKERTRSGSISSLAFMDALIAGYAGSEIGGAEDHVPETHIPWKDIAFDPLSRACDFYDARWKAVAKWLDVEVALATYVPPEPPKPEPPPAPDIPPQPTDPALAPQWAQVAQQIIAQYETAVAQQQAQYERTLAKRQAIIDRINQTAEGAGSGVLSDLDYDDHPAATFCDAKRKRIFVVDMWHKDPQHGWFRCVFTGAGKLFTEAATLKERDIYTNRDVAVPPLKFFSLYVSRDGWRYGEARGMRSPQDEVNMRRSKALHLLTVNQLIYQPGAFADGNVENARKELAKPDGVIETTDVAKIRIERNIELAQGQQQLGQEARAFMEMEGPNPQLQGEQGRATSGRAVLALQQAGLGQLGPIFDRKHEWDDQRYRAYWARIQQFWTAPMYVRVTDDKNAARFAAVNGAPVIHKDNGSSPMDPRLQIGANGGPPMGPEDMGEMGGAPAMQPGQSNMPMQPMMQGGMPGMQGEQDPQEVGPMLAELDMDIIVDRAPEAATLQAEQFEELAKLAQGGIFNAMPPGEVARIMITASALPTKSELLDMLDKVSQQPQGPSPEQQAKLKMLMAQLEKVLAETQKAKAEAARTAAQIPTEQAKTALTGAQARTENVTATMNEFGADTALAMHDASHMHGAAPMMVAASPTGAIGQPPIPG